MQDQCRGYCRDSRQGLATGSWRVLDGLSRLVSTMVLRETPNF